MYWIEHRLNLISQNQIMLTLRMEKIAADIDGILNISHKDTRNVDEHPVVPSFLPPWMKSIGKVNILKDKSVEYTPQFMKPAVIKIPKCTYEYKLIILVQSTISHFSRRMMIRNTWGKYRDSENTNWKTIFLVAKSKYEQDSFLLYKEFDQFEDLIIGDFHEDFYTLSLKVRMGFEWSVTHCKFQFLLKTDDDVFVNTVRLLDFIHANNTPKTKLYAGNVQFRATVFRSGKYGISEKEYKKNVYPRYCSGGGYVLSVDVVRKMNDNFDKVMPMTIDDAYVGELALKSGVDVLHDNKFQMYQECNYNEKLIIHHPVKERNCMEKLFEKHLHLQNKTKYD